ncbi:3-phosphoserine/phosphohydroxythreonine transaminase [Paenibacillus tarimensis]
MNRINNFNPGPAALPLEVLEQAQKEFANYRELGMSVMEMSHRSKEVERLGEETVQLLAELLELPAEYRVLFMGGGASMQFALVPLNFLKPGKVGHYILSGSFSEKAYLEAQTIGKAAILASSKDNGWRKLPVIDEPLGTDSAFVHMTTNNTIEGSQFRSLPDTGKVPLIGDMTSDMMSRKIDFTRFSMFYAAAQKNLGPAGVTVAVIHEELLKECAEHIPTIFNYNTYVQHQSLYNTPPVFSIYLMKLVLEWTERQGGITQLEKQNSEKAKLLYDVIDASGGYYKGIVEKPFRSMMNITWRMLDEELEKRFVQEAVINGFEGLGGHRSVGGLRASAYNAVPVPACKELADFMADFQQRNG